jgi:hypothetical protein
MASLKVRADVKKSLNNHIIEDFSDIGTVSDLEIDCDLLVSDVMYIMMMMMMMMTDVLRPLLFMCTMNTLLLLYQFMYTMN